MLTDYAHERGEHTVLSEAYMDGVRATLGVGGYQHIDDPRCPYVPGSECARCWWAGRHAGSQGEWVRVEGGAM